MLEELALPLDARVGWVVERLQEQRNLARAGKKAGDAILYDEMVKRHPAPAHDAKWLHHAWVADFAELGYCPAKAWHFGRGTKERRTNDMERRRTRGTAVHERLVKKEAKAAAALPVATPRQLSSPRVNLAELAEFKSYLLHDGILYGAKVERAGRLEGDLAIREIKTGRWDLGFDHMLQVWAYAVASPGTLHQMTGGAFSAERLMWMLDYPALNKKWGAYPFTEEQYRIVLVAMSCFREMVLGTQPSVVKSTAARCAPCAFLDGCAWRVT